jgi:hypothetical protein
MRWTDQIARVGEMHTKILIDMPKGRRPYGRLRRRWECSIGMDVREMEW